MYVSSESRHGRQRPGQDYRSETENIYRGLMPEGERTAPNRFAKPIYVFALEIAKAQNLIQNVIRALSCNRRG